jgi:hypothetical protein
MSWNTGYDREWAGRRPRRVGDRYDRAYDGGGRRDRRSGYEAYEHRRLGHTARPPVYDDDLRSAGPRSTNSHSTEPYRAAPRATDPRSPDPGRLRQSSMQRSRWRAADRRREPSSPYQDPSSPGEQAAEAREFDARWASPEHRRTREQRRPWEAGWRPELTWRGAGREPHADYDWVYGARRPDPYGWTGETGRG